MPRPGTGILPEGCGIWTVCRREALATGGIMGRVEGWEVAVLWVHDRHPGAWRWEDRMYNGGCGEGGSQAEMGSGCAPGHKESGARALPGPRSSWGLGLGTFQVTNMGRGWVSLKAFVLLVCQICRSS